MLLGGARLLSGGGTFFLNRLVVIGGLAHVCTLPVEISNSVEPSVVDDRVSKRNRLTQMGLPLESLSRLLAVRSIPPS